MLWCTFGKQRAREAFTMYSITWEKLIVAAYRGRVCFIADVDRLAVCSGGAVQIATDDMTASQPKIPPARQS